MLFFARTNPSPNRPTTFDYLVQLAGSTQRQRLARICTQSQWRQSFRQDLIDRNIPQKRENISEPTKRAWRVEKGKPNVTWAVVGSRLALVVVASIGSAYFRLKEVRTQTSAKGSACMRLSTLVTHPGDIRETRHLQSWCRPQDTRTETQAIPCLPVHPCLELRRSSAWTTRLCER